MNEIIAVLGFVGLAFGLAIAAMIVGCIEAGFQQYGAWKRNRMPDRIRSLNG